MSINREDLERGLQELAQTPAKPSRSYLVPFAEHIAAMRAKNIPYRRMRSWLKERYGLQPSLSTLHHFFTVTLAKQSTRAKTPRHGGKVKATPKMSLPSKMTTDSANLSPQANQSAHAAIRAAKARAEGKTNNAAAQPFVFDDSKPLLGQQPDKQ